MLSSSPIEAEASPDWRLAGLLTYTSTKPSKVRLSRSRALINLCSLLCAHNCGVEADSLRASQKAQVANLYRAERLVSISCCRITNPPSPRTPIACLTTSDRGGTSAQVPLVCGAVVDRSLSERVILLH